MSKVIRALAGPSILAMLSVLTLAGTSTPGEAQESGQLQPANASASSQRIQGVWNVKVSLTDCASGNAFGAPFDAMAVFDGDGAFHDTNANNPTVMVRSDAFGYWKHVRGNRYRFAFRVFNFDMAGMYLGYQVVRHKVFLAADGRTYRSEGTADFFNPDGTPRPPVRGCSASTATRFK